MVAAAISNSATAYEESRRKRIEENQKKLQSLNLPQLSQSLRNSIRPKASPMKKVKPRIREKQVVVVRRSGRVANMPASVYKEVEVEGVFLRRKLRSRNRDLNRVYASHEARAQALEEAERVESGLDSEYPSFVKSMLQSHVSGGFWLGLPAGFCRKNLPKRDDDVTLVDEDNEEFSTVYLAHKTGLSGGWRGFAIAHDLADGDALVFQLLRPREFKVYIIRVSDFEKGNKS